MTEQISSLKQFHEKIESIKEKLDSGSQVLYRGQIDNSWKIKSSLERIGIYEINCDDYYRRTDSLKPLINPLIKTKFLREMSLSGYSFKFDEYEAGSWILPEMEYLTYLRHHGYPTPVIDWTESQYIALFFACEDFVNSKTNGKVFVYKESTGRVRGNNLPELRRIGKYVETDKRHLAQQSQYLIPVIFDGEWKFITFERATENNKLYNFDEIEISIEAKRNILKELRIMNINRYTMYLDEDSLIKNFADELALECESHRKQPLSVLFRDRDCG